MHSLLIEHQTVRLSCLHNAPLQNNELSKRSGNDIKNSEYHMSVDEVILKLIMLIVIRNNTQNRTVLMYSIHGIS
jgi:hypothetical protein